VSGFDAQARGLLGTVRAGHVSARALAVADSRTFVRAMFLASAVRLDVVAALGDGCTFDELVDRTATRQPERLRAWLSVGVTQNKG